MGPLTHTDTQTRVTTIHFASSTTHAKRNSNQLQKQTFKTLSVDTVYVAAKNINFNISNQIIKHANGKSTL